MDIKGHTVHRVLVAEASDIAEEYYVSFLLDRTNRSFLAMASIEVVWISKKWRQPNPKPSRRSAWMPSRK